MAAPAVRDRCADGVIDTHCHLLAGLDDGARSLAESIRMARRIVEEGVEHVVCTPHYSRRYPTTVAAAAVAFAELGAVLRDLQIPLGLSLGAEVEPQLALSASIDELRARALAPARVLVELVDATSADDLEAIVKRLGEAGLAPVIAHPERCQAVQLQPKLLEKVRASGGLVQVVVPSLVGGARAVVGRTAWRILEEGLADLVATDGHRPQGVRLRFRSVAGVVAARLGDAAAAELFVQAPARLVRSSYSGVR
jgi:protein-tyrosine phosphatase